MKTREQQMAKLPTSIKKKGNGAKTLGTPEVYDLVVNRMNSVGNPNSNIPASIVLVRTNPLDPGSDQLYLNQVPIQRDAFNYDAHDKILRWRGAYGGGQLHFSHGRGGAVGVIGGVESPVSVTASVKACFLCDVALNTGAEYVTNGERVVGLTWDADSAAWKAADWESNRLKLTYTVTPGGPIMPPSFTFEFEDEVTDNLPWDPMEGDFEASLSLGNKGGELVWDLVFKSDIAPSSDSGSNSGPDSVYPFWLQAIEDAAAMNINGVLEIDHMAPRGTLVGMQGIRVMPGVVGYYQTSADKVPFGVFDAKLHVNGKPVAKSKVTANALSWSGLSAEHQTALGLPAAGTMTFDKLGSFGQVEGTDKQVQRLATSNALQSIAKSKGLHPTIDAEATHNQKTLASEPLSILGLLPMTPFIQNQSGNWVDTVQEAVRSDLSTIMNSFVPDSIWKLLFPHTPKPALSGELAIVANSPVPNVANPTAWYQQLSTAVMTKGMAGGSDKYCKNMNGPRAAAWLRQEITNSPVYKTHGQLLFQNKWAQLYPQISQYRQDQINNAAQYSTTIDQQLANSIADIKASVSSNGASPKSMVQDLIDKATEAATYAKTNNLFWAFGYFTYNTAPAILANIAMQMSVNTGSEDGTTLARLFQQNITVLTSLDPSGYFARQYNATINAFMTTNILPSMYGFTGKASSFSVIKEYLEQFVAQNINNEDQQIANAAKQLQDILDQKDADKMLADSLEVLRSASGLIQDAMALPYIAQKWEKWFKATYPKFASASSAFGSALIGGVTVLAMYNVVTSYQDWDEMTDEQRAQIVTDSTQLGLQIFSAVVKRGVRLWNIYSPDGMTMWQKIGALSTGETDEINEGMARVSNRFAQWLGDTSESRALRSEMDEEARMMNIGENDVEELTLTEKIFGRNLDEFVATRAGSLFLLASIGFSIYSIAEGESGINLASDIINIVASSLTVFAVVGGWFISAGFAATEGALATMVSVAGPLAIVAALVGLGLMLYELFKKHPDPVQEFVDQYVKPAGFYVTSACSAIDYAIPYVQQANGLLLVGISLSVNNQILVCNSDGSISMGSQGYLPSTVWAVQTDSKGMSQIATLAQPTGGKQPIGLALSLMSDNSISFQPKMSSSGTQSGTGPSVVTQTWLTTPVGNATTANSSTALASIDLTFQPVLPVNGKYEPSQAIGGMVQQGTGVTYVALGSGTTFTLSMEGLAPNFVGMSNLSFIEGTQPMPGQTFGPHFGIMPSTPMTYAIAPAQPDFLDFSTETGLLSTNNNAASSALDQKYTISMLNSLGSGSVEFTITVEAPPSTFSEMMSHSPATADSLLA